MSTCYNQNFSDNDRLDEDLNASDSESESSSQVSEDEALLEDIAGQFLRTTIAEANEHPIEVFTGHVKDQPVVESHIENVQLTQRFIQEISAATLDNGKLDKDVVWRLRNPVFSFLSLLCTKSIFQLSVSKLTSQFSPHKYISKTHFYPSLHSGLQSHPSRPQRPRPRTPPIDQGRMYDSTPPLAQTTLPSSHTLLT